MCYTSSIFSCLALSIYSENDNNLGTDIRQDAKYSSFVLSDDLSWYDDPVASNSDSFIFCM